MSTNSVIVDMQLPTVPIVALDLETTGLIYTRHRIVEIGAVRMEGGQVIEELTLLLNPESAVPAEIEALIGITNEMVTSAPKFSDIALHLRAFIGDAPIAAHSTRFIAAFLNAELARVGETWNGTLLDTLALSRKVLPTLRSHGLGAVCKALEIPHSKNRRAIGEARATAQLLHKLFCIAKESSAATMADLFSIYQDGREQICR